MTWTSDTHPLRIDTVRGPEGKGTIGMTLCPGRTDSLAAGHVWARDLAADFAVISGWDPQLVLTLLEDHEFAKLGVPGFAAHASGLAFRWEQLRIADAGVPDARFETAWSVVGDKARTILRSGGRVLIHCRAGLGRTGMIAARLLVELGEDPAGAIRAVRAARAKTIETRAQEQHVLQARAVAPTGPRNAATLRPDLDEAFVDRVHGMMLGAAIGDALGSAFEFVSSRKIEAALGSPVARDYREALAGSLMYPRRPGIPTDDTAMTLALVDALCDPGPESVELFHRKLVEGLGRRAGPVADLFWKGGPGGACVAMLSVAETGAGPFERLDPNAGGNGAAMRAHPCGIFPDRAKVAEVAALQARFSHPHHAAVASAQVVGLVVHEALQTGRLALDCPPEVNDTTMRRAWEAMHRSAERGTRLPEHLVDVDMAGWNTVAAAHTIAALYEDDPETGIGIAAASGKDTDTVAAVVGAMLGAVHGRRALPKRWIDGLQSRELVEQRVQLLLELRRVTT